MTHTESTPTTEPAASLDALRNSLDYYRERVADLEAAIASAEADEQAHGPTVSPHPCPASGSPLYCECDGTGICKGVPQPTPFDERALADTDAIIDMTGMAVTSTAAVLAIRAAVQYRADQAQARYLAVQHGSYIAGAQRAMVARDTWREALALVDTVIAERMS